MFIYTEKRKDVYLSKDVSWKQLTQWDYKTEVVAVS